MHKAVSQFAGAGGFCEGVRLAGFKVVPTRRRSWPNSRSRRLSAEAAKNAIVARFDAQSYHESSGKRPSFLLLSNHDDRDYRTRTEGTKAKRRGRVHHCGLLRWDL